MIAVEIVEREDFACDAINRFRFRRLEAGEEFDAGLRDRKKRLMAPRESGVWVSG